MLTPTRETPTRSLRAYRDAEVWAILTARSVPDSFRNWRCERVGKERPSRSKIAVSPRNANHIDRSDVLTPEEVGRMADAVFDLRSRQGTRLDTLRKRYTRRRGAALRVGDAERTEYGGIPLLFLTGETGVSDRPSV